MESPSSVTLKELMYDVDVLLEDRDRADGWRGETPSHGGEEDSTIKFNIEETPKKAEAAKQKWWHVADDKIEELIRQSMDLPLGDYVGGSSRSQMGRSPSSPSLSTTSVSGKSPEHRALSRAGGSLVSGRSSSTASLARRKDGKISVRIFIPESGDTLVLRLYPQTRIGPMKKLPSNRFTDIFGEDARSPKASDRPTDEANLKEMITGYSTIEVFRQRLSFKTFPLSNDDLTLEAYGIKDGDMLHLGIMKTCMNERNRPRCVTEASESLQRNGCLSTKRGDSDAWLMPKWVSQDRPNLIGTSKPKNTRSLTDFNMNSIFMPDMQDRSLSRVRVAVTGSQSYTGRT